MLKLECKIEGNRIITLESGPVSKIKNGDVVELSNQEILKPEIQFLISKDILSVVEETSEPSIYKKTDYIRPSVVVFKCNIDKGRRLTLDSIKGSVNSGSQIEIKTSDIHNSDVAYAIKNNLLVTAEVSNEDKEDKENNKIEIKKEKEDEFKDLAENIYKDEKAEKNNTKKIEEISIKDIKISKTKEESPKFRIDNKTKEEFIDFGKEVYKKNSSKKYKTTKVLSKNGKDKIFRLKRKSKSNENN